MGNPFNLTDQKLIKLLDAYFDWIEKNEQDKRYAIEQKRKAEHIRETLLNNQYLSRVSDDELVENIQAYLKGLEGPVSIRIGKPRITSEVEKIRKNLHYLIESSDDPFEKSAHILEGDCKIPYFAKAFWSPILNARYPEILPPWNNKTENFLKKLGINLSTNKLSLKEKYELLSEAFRYLLSLDDRHDVYTLNHLMHYGTVDPEGEELLKKLLGGELSELIEKLRRKHLPKEWIRLRKKSEAMARSMLEKKAGNFTEQELRRFFELLNTDFWNGTTYHNRFGLAYTGKNINALIEQLDETNRWIKLIWDATEDELKSVLDEYYKQKPIKNAGMAFPSVILYLRDPSSFNLYFKSMVEGLRRLTDFHVTGHTADSYFKYNEALNNFKRQHSLEPQELDNILTVNEESGFHECPFSSKTFDLLERLQQNPTREFYQKHKEEFKKHVEEPFQELFRSVASSLNPLIQDLMETEKGLFARIVKNDFGKGGAWDFYWGALYPRGGKRMTDAQLYLWINASRLESGFYIGEYGSEQRNRFVRNAKRNHKILSGKLGAVLDDKSVVYGKHEKIAGNKNETAIVESQLTLQNWLEDPEDAGIHAAVTLSKEEVLQHSLEELKEKISQTYEALFPLVLLAIYDDPMPLVANYLGKVPCIDLNPKYPLSELAKNTGFDEAFLDRWVRAIERKGQVVIYGPPGTGKTYMAEHLARHIIGGGDGFFEIIQFHPAYAYEDFIQGIRPKARSDGQLDFSLVPGRFLEFCERAKLCKDRCVLIIDEINRANLARVFGELMYLLEYRNREVPLASGGVLRIPHNVRIIGTMNTADRSIALVDHALRRRFAFMALYPNYEILRKFHSDTEFDPDPLIKILIKLNKQIGDRHYEVGTSFFLRKNLSKHIEDIWRMEIEPYLEEYFFDQSDRIDDFQWEKIGKEILP